MGLTRMGRGLGLFGTASVRGDGCEECRAPGDVYVDGILFCARCALANHIEAIERLADAPPRPPGH